MQKFILSVCCLLSTLLAGTPAQAQLSLPGGVEQALQQANIPSTSLYLQILPAGSRQPVFSQNADQPASPASTMKLLTTLVALEELGPAYRWQTRWYAEAPIRNGRLNGDLYLRGGADPDLNLERWTSLLRSLRQQGLRQIRGDLVLDRSYFQPERPDLNQPPFDESPSAYYNVIPDALLINNNISSFNIDTRQPGKIALSFNTPAERLRLRSQLSVNQQACSSWEQTLNPPQLLHKSRPVDELVLNGSVPQHCLLTANLNLLDRNTYIADLFRSVWQQLGGSWEGSLRDGHTPPGATLLSSQHSAPLAEIVRHINKHSDNTMARMLYLTLGAQSATPADEHQQAAAARIRNWLERQQIDSRGLVLENGSGLSRSERISAAQLAEVLAVGWQASWNAEFISSLPIAAVDGTMRKRLKDSQADARARIKTGTLNDSVAIAGYVKDPQQRNWVVVAFINAPHAERGRPALDALIDWVAAGGLGSLLAH